MWGPEDEQLGGSEGQPEEEAPRRTRIWPTEQLGTVIKVDRTAAGAKAWRREAKALRGRGKLSAVGAQTGPGAQAEEGHHNPICGVHELDPAGGGGNCLLALCRGVACSKQIILACIFYD